MNNHTFDAKVNLGPTTDIEWLGKIFKEIFQKVSPGVKLNSVRDGDEVLFSVESVFNIELNLINAFLTNVSKARGTVSLIKYFIVSDQPERLPLTTEDKVPFKVLHTPWHAPTGDHNQP